MQRAAEEASRTIAVLSLAYLKSAFAAPEWAAQGEPFLFLDDSVYAGALAAADAFNLAH